jgi:hypothetical protein
MMIDPTYAIAATISEILKKNAVTYKTYFSGCARGPR